VAVPVIDQLEVIKIDYGEGQTGLFPSRIFEQDLPLDIKKITAHYPHKGVFHGELADFLVQAGVFKSDGYVYRKSGSQPRVPFSKIIFLYMIERQQSENFAVVDQRKHAYCLPEYT